ncbi:MAG: glycosyltransferase [Patescibacteria group bacterium]
MPKVSVIISAFNHEKYVAESINSILSQTFVDFELIVVDNGSTDSTYKIIKTIKDPRIRVFRIKKNIGFGHALNYALNKSRGEYISLFSSDDICLPDKLKKQVKYLDDNPGVGAVFTQAQMIDEEGNEIKEYYYDKVFDQKNRNRYEWLNYFFHNGNCICFPSALIRKSFYKKIKYENERLAQLHDFDVWIRLCFEQDIYIFDDKLVKFRIRSGNMNVGADTIENKVRSMFEFGHILKHYLEIKNVGEFFKIFPEAKKRFDDINDNELIPFYVARQALDVKHVFHQKFALDVLFDLLQNKKIVSKLNKKSNFDYTDFIRLSGERDIYHVNHIAYQEELVKTLTKQYEDLKYPLKKLKKIIYAKS